MSIYLDPDASMTACVCDRCGVVGTTDRADGVVVAGWATGQLWLDVSLSQQKQTPLCFCSFCGPVILTATTIQLSARLEDAVESEPSPEDGEFSGIV